MSALPFPASAVQHATLMREMLLWSRPHMDIRALGVGERMEA